MAAPRTPGHGAATCVAWRRWSASIACWRRCRPPPSPCHAWCVQALCRMWPCPSPRCFACCMHLRAKARPAAGPAHSPLRPSGPSPSTAMPLKLVLLQVALCEDASVLGTPFYLMQVRLGERPVLVIVQQWLIVLPRRSGAGAQGTAACLNPARPLQARCLGTLAVLLLQPLPPATHHAPPTCLPPCPAARQGAHLQRPIAAGPATCAARRCVPGGVSALGRCCSKVAACSVRPRLLQQGSGAWRGPSSGGQ